MADPALAAAALHADATRLSTDLATLDLLFESAVAHDLLVYAEALGGHVYHYRDSNRHEIDAVLTMPNGSWAAVEVKVAGRCSGKPGDWLPPSPRSTLRRRRSKR